MYICIAIDKTHCTNTMTLKEFTAEKYFYFACFERGYITMEECLEMTNLSYISHIATNL